jgi:hypothetical protein
MRMAPIAAFVAMPHVIDRRFRMLAFHPERGDQGVLRRYGDASPNAGDVHAHREFEHHSRISSEGESVEVLADMGGSFESGGVALTLILPGFLGKTADTAIGPALTRCAAFRL